MIIHGHYHCDQQHDRNHCDFRDNQPSLLLDRFGADFTNVYEAVIPRVTSNAAFHNIFWSVTLDPIHGKVKVMFYDLQFSCIFHVRINSVKRLRFYPILLSYS